MSECKRNRSLRGRIAWITGLRAKEPRAARKSVKEDTIVYRTTVCGCASKWTAPRCRGTATVPAGEACTSNACGDVSCDTQKLATLTMENQVYDEGFCPADALACGTMFPCLVL